jgi:predicted porin
MKKSLLALAVLGAFAGAASAQSSVTIYGIVDASVAHIDNGGNSINRLDSGQNAGSRIGFKGVEDLGNGLKASFVLENGFNLDTGSNGNNNNGGSAPASTDSTAFSRLAYVGLEGGFGAVRLGRQNSQLKTALAQIDPFETSGLATGINLFGAANGIGSLQERVSNQITYTTPTLSGFSAQAGYAFGETAGDTSANSSWGAQLGYANGPLNVQFAYNNQDLSASADNQTSETKTALIGATYDFGVVKLHGAYGQKKRDGETVADLKVKTALVGVTVPFGANKIRAEYIRNNDDRTNFDNNVVALGYSYALSKRTQFYATYARVDNDRLSSVGFTSPTPAPTVVPGENTSGFAVGIQHNF